MTDKQKSSCHNCGCSEFEYDSYWKEYSCQSCGRILKNDKKISALKKMCKSKLIKNKLFIQKKLISEKIEIPISAPKADVTIFCDIKTVWAFLVKEANWSKWYGVILKVEPRWQKNASLFLPEGDKLTITGFKPDQELIIENRSIRTIIRLKINNSFSTFLEMIAIPVNGGLFTDGVGTHKGTLNYRLNKLKKNIHQMIHGSTKIKTIYSFFAATTWSDSICKPGRESHWMTEKKMIQEFFLYACQKLLKMNPEFARLYSQVESENTPHEQGTHFPGIYKPPYNSGLYPFFSEWLCARGINIPVAEMNKKTSSFGGDAKGHLGIPFKWRVFFYFDIEE